MIGRITLPALPILLAQRTDHQLDIYTDTISGPELIERLYPYDIILAMRERTGLRADVLSQLPNLKAIITCGMRNAAIDLDYCKANHITVCGTESPGHATAELAMMLVGMLARQLYPSAQSMAAGGWQVSTGRDFARRAIGHSGARASRQSRRPAWQGVWNGSSGLVSESDS